MVDLRATCGNMKQDGNGRGAIAVVLSGKAPLPTQHRVFIPTLCGWLGSPPYVVSYLWLKFAGIVFALLSSFLWFSVSGGAVINTALLALFMCFAAVFDYADAYWEIGFFGSCLFLLTFGTVWAGIILFVLTIFAMLNRETAVWFPFLAVLSGQYLLGGILVLVVGVGLVVPRMEYGTPARYCPFNMVGDNLRRMRGSCWWGIDIITNPYLHFLVILLLFVSSLFYFRSGVEWGMALLFVALMIPAVWAEIRVFGPCMLVVIPAISGLFR